MNPGAQYAPGQVLPGTVYRVIRHLATGGMGSVYDVEDTSVEKRYVLKTLHPQLIAREDLARRMRDEAKSLAKLEHPNIVDVITAGVTKDALKMPFYVMERLIGQNLRTVLEKRGALDPMHAYRVAIDVAEALEHAHENAIVHRDVKPENIFLHRNGNGGTTTKLLDFGIVRLLDRKASHTHGKFIGTLRYASPEQVTGREIGPATDIYSLGTVVYEMLCGRGPFDDVGDVYAIGAAHASTPAPPPSRFARVSPDVDRIVGWALAKDPAQRPRDAFTFAVELRRLLQLEEGKPRVETVANVLASKESVVAAPMSMPASATDAARTPPMESAAEGRPPTTRNDRAVSPVAPTVIAPPVSAAPTREAVHAPPGVNVPHVVVRVSSMPAPDQAGIATGFSAPTDVSAGVTPRMGPVAAAGAPGTPPPWTPLDGPAARAPAPGPAPLPGGVPAGPRAIDRAAATRPRGLVGGTKRIAQNDTQVEGLQPAYALLDEPVWEGHANANLTGPIAGEANTRPPPERGTRLLLVGAAFAAVFLVGTAGVVMKLRGRSVASSMPPAIETVTAAPSASPTTTDAPPRTASAPLLTTPTTPTTPPAASSPPSAAPAPSPPMVAPPRAAPRAPAVAPSPAKSGYSPPVKME